MQIIQSLVLGIMMLGWAFPSAASVTYTYTGNNFDVIALDQAPPAGTTFSTSDSLSVTFSVAAPLVDFDGVLSPLDYSFSSGGLTLTNLNSNLGDFALITDASGDIVEWDLLVRTASFIGSAVGDTLAQMSTFAVPGSQRDLAILRECATSTILPFIGQQCTETGTDQARVENAAGTWQLSTSVPEPTTTAPAAEDNLGAGFARKRRTH